MSSGSRAAERKIEEKMYQPVAKRDEIDGLLVGAIDMHCHCGPCLYAKDFDEIQTAKMMRHAGYRGVLLKQHLLGANRVEYVRQAVPGLEIHGGICLNHYTGGLNPFAVAACIIFGGKDVKMPNIHAKHHIDAFGTPTYAHIAPTAGAAAEARLADKVKGITIFDEKEELLPEVHEILELVAEADIGIETGHLSPKESLALVKAAKGAGVTKVWQTHANWEALYHYTMDQVVELADEGAFIELTANFAYSSSASDISNRGAEYTAEIMNAVGPGRCTMASDLGTAGRTNVVEGMRVYVHTMMRHGIEREDIDVMLKDNPAYLLGLS
jgi:hypothetical protein